MTRAPSSTPKRMMVMRMAWETKTSKVDNRHLVQKHNMNTINGNVDKSD